MTHGERLTIELRRIGPLCDDCLSESCGITPRQAVNQVARSLQRDGIVARRRDVCPSCLKTKLVNTLNSRERCDDSHSRETSIQGGEGDSLEYDWYWEGKVQQRIVAHLVERGHAIQAVADTSKRLPGKDVVARTPQGETLWVSVKGFPKRSVHTQARHWFSQALFDMIRYRDENSVVELAIGLPSGFATYQNLTQKIGWFKDAVPFRIFWVHQNGHVEEE